ncbi:PST family polysaccharide transporter [Methanococcus maripaludis]|uniref:PST family polysaccharide transporter n=1 Tax=Methanococcus maripaludis TaxID=39152 RepID=A0A7J9P6J0_METMI|nr:flippase [Methanococcus maripaludis]MBA2858831.1 PST family polysaccharide transporter [Methanococcus maripaludis]
MIKTIQNYLKNEEYKRLFDNFMSLMTLQGLNYILPLITFPYLVRVLGPEKFGLVSFASAFIGYFVIITDYGFNLSATREIALNRENNEKLSEIFSSVMTIKFMLMILSFFLMLLVVFSFDKFRSDWKIYVFTFGMVFGNVLFPVWFFQGIEKMRFITYLNILSKVIFTILIFILVTDQYDYYYVPILNSLGYTTAGTLAIIIISSKFKIKYFLPTKGKIYEQLTSGYYIFLSQLKISLFSNSNIFILGLLCGNASVAYFSAAETLIRVLAMMQIPVVNAIFPYVSKKMQVDKIKTIHNLFNIAKIGSILYIIILFVAFIFSNQIILTFYGESMRNSILIFQILLIVPLSIYLNNIFGTQILLNLGKDKTFFYVLLMTALLNITIIIPLTLAYNYLGTAISMLISEIFLFGGMYYYAKKEIKKF